MSPYVPTEFDNDVNVSKVNPLAEALRLIAGLALMLLVLYAFAAALINFALPHIPVAWENKFWGGFIAFPPDATDNSLKEKQAYLQKLVDALPRESKLEGYDFKVHVIKDKDMNAFAVPGGHILVTTALLDKLRSENSLVFILGHELGHFKNRDHLRGIGMSFAGMLLSFVLTGDGAAGSSVINGIHRLTDGAFSRHQESDADLWGVKALQAHYGHVGGASDFFEFLEKEEKRRIDIELLSTHPLNPTRIEKLKAEIAAQGWKTQAVRPLPWGVKAAD